MQLEMCSHFSSRTLRATPRHVCGMSMLSVACATAYTAFHVATESIGVNPRKGKPSFEADRKRIQFLNNFILRRGISGRKSNPNYR